MIFTHTSNPSIDYYQEVSHELVLGVQRSISSAYLAGGKGLNASMILNQIGIPSIATTFLGGFSGKFIREQIAQYPLIQLDAIEIEQPNRINVKIRGMNEIDINAKGPVISSKFQSELLEKLRALKQGDWLLVCGSLAQDIPEQFLIEVAHLVHQQSAKLVLDIPGIKAKTLGECHPYLIKPNVEELYSMFDLEKQSNYPISILVNRLFDMKVEHVLLSNGSLGAEFYQPGSCWQVNHPALTAVSTVGSGDSMLATFVGKLDQGNRIEEALLWAAAAGEATAVSIGIANYSKIVEMKDNVSIERK